MNPYIETILSGAIILVGVAGAYLITQIASYWSSKRDSIINDIAANFGFTNNEFMKVLLDHVANVVDDVVAAMNTKFKPELIAATKDGKLTDEDKVTLRDKALELIMTELPESIWDELSGVIGNSEEYVKTLIEKSVEAQKSLPKIISSGDCTDEVTEDVQELVKE